FAPGMTLIMEIGGLSRGTQYDAIDATGTLGLGGTLDVDLINGFSPVLGNSFDILDWGTLSGTFGALSLPGLAPGLVWDTSQLYTAGVLTIGAVPEPSTLLLTGFVAAAGAYRWRRHRSRQTAVAV